jgi:hypothetical protein
VAAAPPSLACARRLTCAPIRANWQLPGL